MYVGHSSTTRRLAIGLLVLLAAGCETVTTEPGGARQVPVSERAPAPTTAPETPPAGAQADAAPRPSAWEYLSRAQFSASPLREDHLLEAAATLLESSEFESAASILTDLDPADLNAATLTKKQLLQARMARREGRHADVIRLLSSVTDLPHRNPAVVAEVYWILAQTLIALEQPLEAAKILVQRDFTISSTDAVLENHQALWNVLDSVDPVELRTALYTSQEPVLSGWLDLALLSREASLDPNPFRAGLNDWLSRYPGHPATETIVPLFQQPLLAQATAPRRIALLLPLTSVYGQAASAFQAGFLALHEANSNINKAQVALYDVGTEPSLSPIFYRMALDEGADFIVGPLGRQAVEALLRETELAVPTLLLGVTPSTTELPAHVAQLGLQPEAEARQAAIRAYQDGKRMAAIVYPQTEWGQCVQSAFIDTWTGIGGIVTAAQSYAPDQSDYSVPIRELLDIDESEMRHMRLQSVVAGDLEFEPRRRHDIDFIFMAANATQARLLKPQIDFFHAHDLPVYATSHVFTGRPDPILDVDLDGIAFADMPWMLGQGSRVTTMRQSIQGEWPGRHSQLDRLYALGLDAYSIIPLLGHLAADSARRFNGVTATLQLMGRTVNQRLVWARFSEGIPRLISPVREYDNTVELRYHASEWRQSHSARHLGGTQGL